MDTTPPLHYCLYARKSTDSDERQVMSIDSQIKEMLQLAQRDGLRIDEVKQEAHSAKATLQRPVFNGMIRDIQSGKFNAILTWAPDRLSRNAGDLGVIVDLLDQKKLVEVRTFGQRFTDSPSEKFLFMILGAQGKLENDQKGVNVKRGLRAKCEMGFRPGPAPTGYLNEKRVDRKCHIIPDPERAPIVRQMFEKVGNEGWSGRKVYRWLREIGFTTPTGRPIWISNVQKILNSPIYMGEFEYPVGSGNWYQGKHEPIISKELYLKSRESSKRESEFRFMSKDFAFTRLMRCGICGSGVTAQEKHKQLAKGGSATYVYYGCTRAKDINCPVKYINEKDLVVQLSELLDSMSMDEFGLRKHLKEDIERHEKFQTMLGGEIQKIELRDVELRNYAKHILRVGTTMEKRQILSHLKNRIVLKDRILTLEDQLAK